MLSDALSAVQSTSNPQIDGILKNIKVDKLEVAVVVKASKVRMCVQGPS